MPRLLNTPVIVEAAGTPPKKIAEFVGRASTDTSDMSIAWMRSPEGWSEPAQAPEFDEYSIVISGSLVVEGANSTLEVRAGEAILVPAGERVRYSTPEGAEYLAVCLPAFSPELVHRDAE
jgi:ethanolamine utilization protein EutQ (cupin superfamily)